MYRRWIEGRVREALQDTPVVLVVGPRRSGKTTLVRLLTDEGRTYLTLDDQSTLDVARVDPVGFIRGLDAAVIDEVQRVPELLLAIKKSVDDDRRPGRVLLTGSSNVMTLPRVADSLAGRIETIRLLPLAQGEVLGSTPRFLQNLYTGRFRAPDDPLVGIDMVTRVVAGGFPEVLERPTERRRRDWTRAYLHSVLSRDLRDITEIEKLTDVPRFVRLLAERSGQLVNYSRIGAGIGVSYKTAQRYVALLDQIFLISTLQPWHKNAAKRLVKTPKLHFLDTGLLSGSLGLTAARVKTEPKPFGAVLESFVHAEILKLLEGAGGLRSTLYHYRDHQQREVDIVLEREDGVVACVDVKAGATVRPADFAGMRALAEASGTNFAAGVLLYDGETVVPFGGPNLVAAPLSCLWT